MLCKIPYKINIQSNYAFQANVEEFTKDFILHVMHALQTDYKIRNPYFDRLIDFIVKFLLSLDVKINNSDNSLFLNSVWELIAKVMFYL